MKKQSEDTTAALAEKEWQAEILKRQNIVTLQLKSTRPMTFE
jgi:hypothetical protein